MCGTSNNQVSQNTTRRKLLRGHTRPQTPSKPNKRQKDRSCSICFGSRNGISHTYTHAQQFASPSIPQHVSTHTATASAVGQEEKHSHGARLVKFLASLLADKWLQEGLITRKLDSKAPINKFSNEFFAIRPWLVWRTFLEWKFARYRLRVWVSLDLYAQCSDALLTLLPRWQRLQCLIECRFVIRTDYLQVSYLHRDSQSAPIHRLSAVLCRHFSQKLFYHRLEDETRCLLIWFRWISIDAQCACFVSQTRQIAGK